MHTALDLIISHDEVNIVLFFIVNALLLEIISTVLRNLGCGIYPPPNNS